MATLDAPPPVNLAKSIFLCNIFNFCFSSSKACLFPFLTIYLKHMGLSAAQAGIIIGVKTLVGFVFAPLWARCAVRCGRRRCMLMFSIFMLAATYLSLTAVPSLDDNAFSTQCRSDIDNWNVSGIVAKIETTNDHMVVSTTPVGITGGVITVNTTSAPVTNGTTESKLNANNTNGITVQAGTETNSTMESPTSVAKTEEPAVTTATPQVTNTEGAKDAKMMSIFKQLLEAVGIPESKIENLSLTQLTDYVGHILRADNGDKIIAAALDKLPPDVSAELLKMVEDKFVHVKREIRDNSDKSDKNEDGDSKTWASSLEEKLFEKLHYLQNQVKMKYDTFIVVLVLMMVGEVFCSPLEKIADDGWFEFLESIDDLEQYGMQRVWSSFAYILLPIIVTLSVDNTNCLFGLQLHPFMLHFYMFGGFLGLSFLLAFFYPLSTSEKYKYASKVVKGMRVVFCNARSLLFVFTVLVMGMIYSSYYNFLFWMLLDMGSKEITMGLCLTIAASVELPMLLFNDKLTKKIGNGGVIVISLLFLCARCWYYSILWSPWAVIPAEITHAFTHTAMWWAVLSSKSFNITPAIGRSIRSILSSFYFGIGFAAGSVISGFIYSHRGPVVLFQAGAILSACCFPILTLGIYCFREPDRTKVKYTRLLTTESGSDDESTTMEDDWLEQALKDK